jgi:hypothetical protein
LDNIGSLPFISWAISMKLSDCYFFMPIYVQDVPSFVEKYSKIKYAISDSGPIGGNWIFVKHLFYH